MIAGAEAFALFVFIGAAAVWLLERSVDSHDTDPDLED
jgi:hypothetical protein